MRLELSRELSQAGIRGRATFMASRPTPAPPVNCAHNGNVIGAMSWEQWVNGMDQEVRSHRQSISASDTASQPQRKHLHARMSLLHDNPYKPGASTHSPHKQYPQSLQTVLQQDGGLSNDFHEQVRDFLEKLQSDPTTFDEGFNLHPGEGGLVGVALVCCRHEHS